MVAALFADVVDRADVRVIEDGGRARLALESLDGLPTIELLVDDELQSDVAPEADIFGLIDDAHAALAEDPKNSVVGNRLADHGDADEVDLDRIIC
jgi:hypothetical protein